MRVCAHMLNLLAFFSMWKIQPRVYTVPSITWGNRVRRNYVVDPLFRHLGIKRMEERLVSLKFFLVLDVYILNKRGMLKYFYKSSIQWYHLIGERSKIWWSAHTLCWSVAVFWVGCLLTFRERIEMKWQRLFTGENQQNSWKYYFTKTLQYCTLLVLSTYQKLPIKNCLCLTFKEELLEYVLKLKW